MSDPRYSHCCPYAGPWFRLYFLPEPQGHESFRPTLAATAPWFTPVGTGLDLSMCPEIRVSAQQPRRHVHDEPLTQRPTCSNPCAESHHSER